MKIRSIFFILFVVTFSNSIVLCQYDIHKLSYPVNTDVYDEICPLLSYAEDELFFTRVGSNNYIHTLIENGEDISKSKTEAQFNHRLKQIYSEIAGTMVSNPTTSSFNQDVFFAKYVEGEVYNTFHPPHPLNNALPNSICAHYGTDGGYVVINTFGKNGGMSIGFSYVERQDKLDFTFPEPIEIMDFDMSGSDINLTMSGDKSYIILAMKEPGQNKSKDLYLSTKVMEGKYAQPRKLKQINTSYDESTPFFSQDGRKLFFASNRPGGIGGMDIYETTRIGYSFDQWTKPVLLDKPVNSKFDDSHPYISLDGTSLLFTSNRDGTSDIFYGIVRNIEDLDYSLRINVVSVTDGVRTKVPSEMMWGDALEDGFPEYFRSWNGSMKLTFTDNKKMKIKAEIRGRKSEVVILDPIILNEEGVREIDIELIKNTKKVTNKSDDVADGKVEPETQITKTFKPKKLKEGEIPLELNSTVVLKNIYFAKSQPSILSKSHDAIETLAEALKRNPNVVIRIEGHTDNVGDKGALLELSQQRADAIASYLIKEGVSPEQLKTKGYGDTRPITQNRSEKERSANRRVEITILEQ